MNRKINTICPYTLSPLNSIKNNGEHVIPAGLGVPESFTVKCSAKENTKMNLILDEPFLNMSYIKFMLSTSGVCTRSGISEPFFCGKTIGTGDEVLVKFSPDNLDFKMKIPVRKDEENKIFAVVGYDNEVGATLKKVRDKYESKGFAVSFSESVSLKEDVRIRLEVDLKILYRQILKIAYLSTVYVYGDDAITCSSSHEIIERLNGNVQIDAPSELIKILPWDIAKFPVLPEIAKNKHTIATFNFGGNLLSAVSLFGHYAYVVSIKNRNMDTDDVDGMIYEIDYRNRSMIRRKYTDFMEDKFKNGIDEHLPPGY
ncbi:hypothetical protein [Rahnella aceris]|uniref:hypothetical protein n=1 Tax=Rahnella sp. (strain Y9602) TaxID=2703885 RepID=UPI001F534CCA|nr:hypothetical protein [Rahnella aceris]UNK55609.1 hypothetical protein MNO10_23885 [Rahnella aceris]